MGCFHEKPLKLKTEAGYTMIEVLMALAIFSLGIMAMGALQSSSLMATGDIGRKTEAWAILDDRAEFLKVLPFYANKDGLDNDGDTTIDEADEEHPDLQAGNHQVSSSDGRYNIHWEVVDDQPIPAVVVPPVNPGDPILPGVPNGTYTVSKTISVQVVPVGGNPQTEALAMVEFVKSWAAQGIP